jgi:inhibitor of KinA sporulation pathway (predicted exonuclease)
LRPILKPALSSECTTLTGYTIERIVEQKTIYLEDFLKELDKQLLKLNIHPSQVENEFTFVVDGPLHLRQALIPECTKKDLSLPFFFYEYFDLRREFKKYLSSTTTNSSFSSPHNKFPTLVDIAKCIITPTITFY